MALRAGSYDATKPLWRGVIRENSYPAFTCIHKDHPDQRAATQCAREALSYYRDHNGVLPNGWTAYTSRLI